MIPVDCSLQSFDQLPSDHFIFDRFATLRSLAHTRKSSRNYTGGAPLCMRFPSALCSEKRQDAASTSISN